MKNLILFILLLFCSSCIDTCSIVNDTTDFNTKEIKLSSQIKVCEWFLQADGSLKAKESNILNMEKSLSLFDKDSQIYSLKYQELSGLKSSYNNLVGEFNANLKRYSKTRYIDCSGNQYKEYQIK